MDVPGQGRRSASAKQGRVYTVGQVCCRMIRSRGFRVNLAGSQADKLYAPAGGRREAYSWAVSKPKDDPTLTGFDLQKEFTALRQATSHLRQTERLFQQTAIHQARTARDTCMGEGGSGRRPAAREPGAKSSRSTRRRKTPGQVRGRYVRGVLWYIIPRPAI